VLLGTRVPTLLHKLLHRVLGVARGGEECTSCSRAGRRPLRPPAEHHGLKLGVDGGGGAVRLQQHAVGPDQLVDQRLVRLANRVGEGDVGHGQQRH
jgi:hypothetical protein